MGPVSPCDVGLFPDAADVGSNRGEPGNERGNVVVGPRGGNGRQDFAAHRLLDPQALDVDGRRCAADRDRFLQAAHFQLGIDGRHERPRQLDAIAFDGAKPVKLTVTA